MDNEGKAKRRSGQSLAKRIASNKLWHRKSHALAVKTAQTTKYADVAELADALVSGTSECTFMWVQVPSSAPEKNYKLKS